MAASSDIATATIELCQQAAECLLTTPGRQGCLVELDEQLGEDVLIAADLHGHRLNFRRVCRTADLSGHTRRHLVVQEICHGGPGYPDDGGCMSHLMLEDVARLIVAYPGRVHFLLGNHELAELTDFPIRKGCQMLNLQFRRGIETFYGEAAAEVRAAYMRMLRACPLAIRMANGVFVSHSLPDPCHVNCNLQLLERPMAELDLTPEGDVFPLLWGRDYRAATAEAFAKAMQSEVLIHGHEPCDDGFLVPNGRQIILDCSRNVACYLLVKLAERPTHAGLVERIERLDHSPHAHHE